MRGFKPFARKALAGVAAAATLLTGLAFASSANVATYGADDNFHAGELDSSIPAQLTVTKYLSNEEGQTGATGSSQDSAKIPSTATPAEGVIFSLTEIQATGSNSPENF